MNRKSKAKETQKVGAYFQEHPYNDATQWIGRRFTKAPWSDEKIAEFQKKIDSAFGAESAFILAWSGDRKYWDGFYTDWHFTGLPKQDSFELKPQLLYGSYPVNEQDYIYIIAPRWVIYERGHVSEYGASYKASSWIIDETMIGGKKRIRKEKPPESMFTILRIIASHQSPALIGEPNPCCDRLWSELQRNCYGKYREPSDSDLSFIRNIRINMDADGVAQRNDTARDAKMMARAESQTKLYVQQAERQRAKLIEGRILDNAQDYFKHILDGKGSTLSAPEIEKYVLQGIQQSQQKRLAESENKI